MLNNDKYNIKVADGFFQRLLGLMFKKNINYALLFNKCKSVHTFFMFMNIDILALDNNDNIIKTYKNVKPGRIIIGPKGTKKILEVPTKINK